MTVIGDPGASVSGFGDFDPDDAFDASGVVDPDQVALKLARLYDELGEDEHGELNHAAVARRLVAWLIRQGGVR